MDPHRLSQPVTVLFADVSGSTRLCEVLGDIAASEVIQRCLELMKAATAGHQGCVIESKGDEILATFADAGDAVCAARDMMRRIDREPTVSGLWLALRIGIHHGPVLPGEGLSIFGDTVNTAARIVGLARARQILTSSSVADRLPEDLRRSCRDLQTFALKGKNDEIDIFDVLWQDRDDFTILAIGGNNASSPQHRLILRHGADRYEIGPLTGSLTIGRESGNDIVIEDRRISRNHARLESRREKFVLIDRSTNGTHVLFDDRTEYLLRMEEVALHGRGSITLGRPHDDSDSTGQLDFEVV